MLNTITAVQECDATEVQSGKLSWEQKSLSISAHLQIGRLSQIHIRIITNIQRS